MKTKIKVSALVLFLTIVNTYAQVAYDENVSYENMTTGVLYQAGPGANNALNWKYPYGTKLTVNSNLARNFEITSIDKSNNGYAVRQLDQNTSSWTSWRNFVLDDGEGNLGIGTSNPDEKLHVEGSLLLDSYSLGNNTGIFFREGFNSSTNNYNLSILNYDHSDNGSSPDGLSINAYDGVSFSTGASTRNQRMIINRDGNVGIGTTPGAKLEVNGNVKVQGHADESEFLRFESDRPWAFKNKGTSATSALVLESQISGKYFDISSKINANKVASFFTADDASRQRVFLVQNGGRVGIGTVDTDPNAKLHIAGNVKVDVGEGFKLHGDSNYFGTNYDGVIFEIQDVNGSNAAVDGGIVFRGLTTTDSVHKDIMVLKGTGNVGIGTTTPEAKLEVNGDISNGGTDFVLGKLDGRDQGSNTRNRALVHNDGDRLEINFDGDFEGGTTMHGNVGIGTRNTDGARLTVAGNIHAREIKVTIDAGADFVFADNYDLPKLEEVAAFVKENKHLPQIAPASIMEKEGLELGEMNIRLLQKVEELTLYTIEQENKLGEQEQELKSNKEDFEYYKKLQDQKMQILLDRLQALEQNKN